MSEQGDSFWSELSVYVDFEDLEGLSELLQEITGAGVTIHPPIKALGPDEGYVLHYGQPYLVQAYIYGPVSGSRRSHIRRQVNHAGLGGAIRGNVRWRTLREVDWANTWKDHYDIEQIGRIVIRPAWREYKPAASEVVVSLDPGMAFGTGQHPTTRMCLLALQDVVKSGDRVLDLGAGSGILAFAAVALGARDALCVDVEEQAVAASIANAELNEMSDRIEVAPAGSIELAQGKGPFDLVLANIIARIIIALAPDIVRQMKPGAALITSGIIMEREEETLAALAAAGLEFETRLEEGDWRAFVHRAPRHLQGSLSLHSRQVLR